MLVELVTFKFDKLNSFVCDEKKIFFKAAETIFFFQCISREYKRQWEKKDAIFKN